MIKLIFLYILTFFVGLFIPKSKRLVSISSNGGKYYAGNAKAMYEYLKKDNFFIPYYFLTNKEKYEKLSKNDKSIRYYYSLKSFFIIFRSKTILVSHGYKDFPGFFINFFQNFILLHHGLCSKVTSFLNKKNKEFKKRIWEYINHIANQKFHTIVTSDFERYFLSSTYFLSRYKIHITGYPRNDVLFNKSKKEKYKTRNKAYKNLLYVPTWREHEITEIFPFEDFDFNKLISFLQDNNIKLYIRFHPNNYQNSREKVEKYFLTKSIIDLGPDKLDDVQDFLPEVDVLITDYSSVCQDFLFLDRPMIFIPYDLQELNGLYEPLKYDLYYTGVKVFTFEQFLDNIKKIIEGKDLYKEERTFMRRLLFNDIDN